MLTALLLCVLGCGEDELFPPMAKIVDYMKPGETDLSQKAISEIDSLVYELSIDMGNSMMVCYVANDTHEVKKTGRDNYWYLDGRSKSFSDALKGAVKKLPPDLKNNWEFVEVEQREFSKPQDLSVLAIFEVNPAELRKIDWRRDLVWEAIEEKQPRPAWAPKK